MADTLLPPNIRDLDSVELFHLGKSAVTVGSLTAGVVIIVITLLITALMNGALKRWRGKADDAAAPTVYVVEKLVTYGIIIAGVSMGLTALGLDLSSFTLFAGALGVGIGLGLQGLVKEFISGLVLLFDHMVRIGDYIELSSGKRGIVQEISLRATRIRNNDDVDVLIPNSHLIDQQVINWTAQGKIRRFHIPFSVAYGSDKAAVRDVVLKAAREVPFTAPEEGRHKSQVWLIGFGESALNFELVVWPTLEAVKRPNSVRAAYTWAIEDALRSGGFEMPFPQMDLRLRSLFGEEGRAALGALNLKPVKSAPQVEASASPNDAVEDVLQPDDEPEPPAQS